MNAHTSADKTHTSNANTSNTNTSNTNTSNTNTSNTNTSNTNVAILTAGGIAPCLSYTIAALTEAWAAQGRTVIGYRHGYAGLLTGDRFELKPESAPLWKALGGSPLGSSRVKLTNASDCEKRNLTRPGQDPLDVAADQLVADRIGVLHTIGGDDTSTMAAALASRLSERGLELIILGLPKTIDNDIVPVELSLGAQTAAEQSALFAANVSAEHTANPRMLVVHEIMGRNCGWLAANTARLYVEHLERLGVDDASWYPHALWLPELSVSVDVEIDYLAGVMDRHGCVNVFLAEGAGVEDIIADMAANGHEIPVDSFGHPKLDAVNPGAWFAARIAAGVDAQKTLVTKSGYFARSAPAGVADRNLIDASVAMAVKAAGQHISGVVGLDSERLGELRVIEFDRISGGGRFDTDVEWFDILTNTLESTR